MILFIIYLLFMFLLIILPYLGSLIYYIELGIKELKKMFNHNKFLIPVYLNGWNIISVRE